MTHSSAPRSDTVSLARSTPHAARVARTALSMAPPNCPFTTLSSWISTPCSQGSISTYTSLDSNVPADAMRTISAIAVPPSSSK